MHTIEYLRTAEVAERLNVHPRTVHRWAKTGALKPAVVMPGYRGDYLFDPTDVAEFEQERSA